MLTIHDYLNALPPDRQVALKILRDKILENLPVGYEEVLNWGMITYQVPLSLEPNTYNGKPLMYAALDSKKNHMAVHLCSLSCVPNAVERFASAWKGKKLDMGKACVRFKKLEDVDIDLVGITIASVSVADYVSAFKQRYARGRS
jgi:uncharacterized protein YdhG (YjbR/CyaY superfamily)